MIDTSSLNFPQLEQQYGLPSGLLNAVMQVESRGNPNAISPKGAQGLFQFMPATAQQYGIDPNDPVQASQGAARYYSDLLKQNNGNLDAALASYNFGPGNVAAGKSLPQETQDYIRKVKGLLPTQMADSGQISNDATTDNRPSLDEIFSANDNNKPSLDEIFGQNQQKKQSVDKFDTIADNTLQGATFGLGNRAQAGLAALIASGINGKSVAENYKDARNVGTERIAQEFHDNPLTAFASNLGGAVTTGGLAAGTKAGTALTNLLRSGNIASRIGKGALAGAASGAAYGAGTAGYGQSAEGAKSGALTGAVVGGAIPGAGAAVSSLAQGAGNAIKGAFARSPEALQDAASALKSKAGDLYNQMRQIGATFNPQATKSLVSNINNAVSSNQFIPDLNPKTIAIVKRIEDSAQNGTLGLDDLDQYRRILGRVGNSEDGVSAGKVRTAIDNFVNNSSGKDLVAGGKFNTQDLSNAQNELQKLQNLHDNLIGNIQSKSQLAGQQGGFWRGKSVTQAADDAKNLANVKQQITKQSNLVNSIQSNLQNAPLAQQQATQAVNLLNQGRKQYQQASKFQDITDILSKAAGDPNKIKSALARFVTNKDNLRGYTADEINALKAAAKNTTTEKLLKMGGKFGIDLGTSFSPGNTIGPVIGGLVNPIVPVAGTLARQGQKYIARGKAENLLNVLQNGSAAPSVIQQGAPALSALAGSQAGSLTQQSPMRIGLKKISARNP